jgi:hypothetical protein
VDAAVGLYLRHDGDLGPSTSWRSSRSEVLPAGIVTGETGDWTTSRLGHDV